MPFVNPFKKHDRSSYPGVLIPLADGSPTKRRRHDDEDGEKERGDSSSTEEKGAAPSPTQYTSLTLESLRAEVESDVAASGHDSSYDRKSKVINRAVQDIGMGRYQWQLFILCGFGWTADNLWLQGVALTLPKLSTEFGVDSTSVKFTTCALFTGLCVGALTWGTLSDVVGRRLAFNLTLFICGLFGLVSASGESWVAVCSMFATLGFGVGGNLPVDGALFLEFLPFASGNLLTMLSVWWPVGNLVASLVAWGFVPNYSCEDEAPSCSGPHDTTESCCHSEDNKGWRWLVLTLGAITFGMFMCRFFLFHLYESPKFLLSRGRQDEAVATVHALAYKNKKKTWITTDILNEIGGHPDEVPNQKLPISEIVKRQLEKFSGDRIAPLFADRKLAMTTVLLWFCWTTIGMGYPLYNAFLPQYIGNNAPSTEILYRNYAITSAVGVPGSILACFAVDMPYLGRKGTIAIATLVTGVLIFCFTISTDPDAQLACSSLVFFSQNIMYGVLYAYTPEVFPAPNRGTGTGISSALNRIAGLCAPIVAIYAGDANPKSPIYASGGLLLAAFVAMCLFPIETRGRPSL